MKTSPKAALAALFLPLLLASCAKPAAPGLASAPVAATPAATPAPKPAAQATAPAAGDEAFLPVVETALESPWYAKDFEELGFYVFPEPVVVPDFEVERLSGGRGSRSELEGKIVLLNFWATWCPPCRAEMPSIEALGKAMKGEAFSIMAISVGESKKTVADFIAAEKFSFPIYLDQSGALGSSFNARSIPTTYVLDKQGRVVAGLVGSRNYDGPELTKLFRELARR